VVRLSSKCLFGAPLANFASFGLKLVSLETTITPSGVSNLKAKLSVIGGYGVRNAVTFTAAVCNTTPSSVMSLAISSLRRSGRPLSSIRVAMSKLFSSK